MHDGTSWLRRNYSSSVSADPLTRLDESRRNGKSLVGLVIDQELAAISNNLGGSVSPEIAGVWSDEMIDFMSMQKRMEHNSLEILRSVMHLYLGMCLTFERGVLMID